MQIVLYYSPIACSLVPYDFKKSMCQRLEQLVCEQRARLGYDGNTESFIDLEDVVNNADRWDEREDLDELSEPTLNRYIDKASRQIRKPSRFDSIKTTTKIRQQRRQGIAKANSRLSHFNNDEYSNTTNEGILGAVASALKGIATQTVAHGLGVGSGTVSKFVGNLSTNRQKKYMAPQKPAKPVHTKPATTASLHTSPIHRTVTPGEVHSAIAKYPGEHEDHLNSFVNHHNAAMAAKAKGDRTAAAVQCRARNHALVRYQQTAPKAYLKHLNTRKVSTNDEHKGIVMSHIYLAGPIRGMPDCNREMFDKVARELRGLTTLSPVKRRSQSYRGKFSMHRIALQVH